MDIRFVSQEDIDKNKWNSCIYYARNGNIFGYYWYLTNVVKEWDALVEGDYESVMPLIRTVGSFFKKSKLYSHPLLRSTGLYSVHVLSEKRINSFFEAIPKKLQRGYININEGIKIPKECSWVSNKTFSNGLLLLKESYDQIAENYSPSLCQKLERANLAQLFTVNNLKPEVLVDFYKTYDSNFKEVHYHAYLRVMYNAIHRGWGVLSGVKNPKGGLLAANFFMISNQRFMSLLPVVSPSGEKQGALEFLFDISIRIQAEKPMILDFNLHEYNSFAEQFGAVKSPFFQVTK